MRSVSTIRNKCAAHLHRCEPGRLWVPIVWPETRQRSGEYTAAPV